MECESEMCNLEDGRTWPGEQGQEIESKEEPTKPNVPRPAMAMDSEKDWPILTKPQAPIQLGSGWQGALHQDPDSRQAEPIWNVRRLREWMFGRLSKFPVLCRKGFARLKESSRMALQDGSLRELHQRDAWSVSSVAGAFVARLRGCGRRDF